jgi:hypothetical protein
MGKRISVASAKAKGRNLQKWVCKKIAELLGVSWGYEDEAIIKPRPMGQAGVDVIISEEWRKEIPFSIECKSAENWNVKSAIKQAKANQKKDTTWLLVLKDKSMKNPVVVLDFIEFFRLLEIIHNGGKID